MSGIKPIVKNISKFLILPILLSILEVFALFFVFSRFDVKVSIIIVSLFTVFVLTATTVRAILFWNKSDISKILKGTINFKDLPKDQIIEYSSEIELLAFSFILALIPGLITDLSGFLLLIPPLSSSFVARSKNKKKMELKQTTFEQKPEKAEEIDKLLHVDTFGLEIGYNLVKLVDSLQGGDFLERIKGIRRRFAMELGLVVPPIRIRDNMQLAKNEYLIQLKENIVGQFEVHPELYALLVPNDSDFNIDDADGISFFEPVFNLPSKWISPNEKDRLESKYPNLTIVEPASVLATHITQVVKDLGFELLSRQDVKNMVDKACENNPILVQGIIPDKIQIEKLHRILQNLIKSNTPIRNIIEILEVLGDYADSEKSVEELSEILIAHIQKYNPAEDESENPED